MSSGRFGFSARRGGGRRGGRDRGVVDSIREATGASVEDIQYQLQECEGDVNKATEQLIDCKSSLPLLPFCLTHLQPFHSQSSSRRSPDQNPK